jgi:hypothetical protein
MQATLPGVFSRRTTPQQGEESDAQSQPPGRRETPDG